MSGQDLVSLAWCWIASLWLVARWVDRSSYRQGMKDYAEEWERARRGWPG